MVTLETYRKPTHTDQYLSFESHHPLAHKLGVIRTLFDRKDNLITDPADRIAEEQHIIRALETCGYPKWAFNKVKQAKAKKQQQGTRKKPENAAKTKGMVVVPYVGGLTEKLERIYRKHHISTAVKPHRTLRSYLVHPKDKIEDKHKSGVVYCIPCNNCEAKYIGETGRPFGVRLEEHKKEAEKTSVRSYMRSARKTSEQEQHKSAITDHVVSKNHVMNWEEGKVIAREDLKFQRWVQESIHIRQTQPNMNRDEGCYHLSNIWDQVTSPLDTSKGGGTSK